MDLLFFFYETQKNSTTFAEKGCGLRFVNGTKNDSLDHMRETQFPSTSDVAQRKKFSAGLRSKKKTTTKDTRNTERRNA